MGVQGAIDDEAAIKFYNTFYEALGAGRSIHAACGQAQARLRFDGVPKTEIPALYTRDGVDARQFRLVPGARGARVTP